MISVGYAIPKKVLKLDPFAAGGMFAAQRSEVVMFTGEEAFKNV